MSADDNIRGGTTRFAWLRWLGTAALLAAVALAWWRLPSIRDLAHELSDQLRSSGAWGPLGLALFYIPASLLLVPGSFVTLLGAFALGFWPALAAVSIGSTLGACASFLVSRYLLRDWLTARLANRPGFRAIDSAVAGQGFRIVLLTRLSPILPFGPLNYAFGLTSISLGRFALGSWLGMLPGTLMYVYLGAAAHSLADLSDGHVSAGPWQVAFLCLGLLATVVVTVAVTRLASRALRQAMPEGEAAESSSNS